MPAREFSQPESASKTRSARSADRRVHGVGVVFPERKHKKLLPFRVLANIVTPSAYIRPEFVSFAAELKDDSVIDGLMVESTPSAVTLLDRNNTRHLLARDRIRELRESAVSLMPEGLLEALPPKQVIDLFAYLQANDPAAVQGANPQSPAR